MKPDPALDTAIAALHAVSNLVGVLLDLARDAGAPADLLRHALDQLDAANEAVIVQPESSMLLGAHLATLRARLNANMR
ncbi:hypothetical protein QH494_16070 [Sphingomonas sp. AR_OL41]|uniref:hypothetical protein n=1 Tax=Sphingomonas sp. AR_OL41 TaxID=3042729 RepID=UPI00248108E0|nr:hypothetical protein [Sphingomonas sp. AR_OL41]MDH7973709.1 hypothetical protein [Sphingomonas sp. AR_OL41]